MKIFITVKTGLRIHGAVFRSAAFLREKADLPAGVHKKAVCMPLAAAGNILNYV